jgi:hypothetical protein
MASAFIVYTYTRKRTWLVFAAVYVIFAALFFLVIDSDAAEVRYGWSLALAIIPTLIVILIIGSIGYIRLSRNAKVRVPPGAVLESSFGPQDMTLSGPLGATRLPDTAVTSVVVKNGFVFLRQPGVPFVSVWPQDLFPDEILARLPAR